MLTRILIAASLSISALSLTPVTARGTAVPLAARGGQFLVA